MRSRTLAALLGLATLGLLLLAAASAGARTLPDTSGFDRIHQACAPAAPGDATCFALVRTPVPASSAGAPGVRPFTSRARAAAGEGISGGFTPAQLAGAYGYDPTKEVTQTIGIVDAFDDPSIEADLKKFDEHYGLAECTKANGCFKKVGEESSVLPEKDKEGWSEEISLDVETARAVCQKCKIVLVEASSTQYKDLAKAANEAVALGATEVSNSYGGPELGLGATERAAYEHPGVVVAAATGDFGYENWNLYSPKTFGWNTPNAPASLPSVLSVGGTSLTLKENGTREAETVWNDEGPYDEFELPAGYIDGGGCSTLFAAPPWQQDVTGFSATGCGTKRLSADVSADADPETGFDIFDNYNCGTACEGIAEAVKANGGWETFGGTSLSTPIIASMYALAGGAPGTSSPALPLYGHLGDATSLFDVTHGSNGICDGLPSLECGEPNSEFKATLDCEGTSSCNARSGYDGPSGVGTPVGLAAFQPLFPSAAITLPATAAAGEPATFGSASSTDPYPGGTITGWTWSWGDGTPASKVASPSHTYAAPGDYTVKLIVTDSYGFTSSVAAERSVHVLTEAEGKQKREEEEAKKHEEEEEHRKQREKEEVEAREKHEREEAEAKEKHDQEEAEAKKKHEEEVKQHEEEEKKRAAEKKHEEEVKKEHEAEQKRHEEEALLKGPPVTGTSSAGGAGGASPSTGVQSVAGFQGKAPAPSPNARLASTSLQVSASGWVTLKVTCPAGESACLGSITLRTLSAVNARVAGAARKLVLTLGTASFDVAGGRTGPVKLHLSAKARAMLARSHTMKSRATLASHDAQGATDTFQATVTLHAAPPKRRGG
jgi:PKD repeat protein